jgi:hypothetical protein
MRNLPVTRFSTPCGNVYPQSETAPRIGAVTGEQLYFVEAPGGGSLTEMN